MQEVVEKVHIAPHQWLGLHSLEEGGKIIRLFRPGAEFVYLEVFGKIVEAQKTETEGVFTYAVPEDTTFLDYRIYHHSGLLAHDPYAFLPTFGEMDAYLFSKGVHYELFRVLGGRVCEHQGVKGAKFAVWAPNAKSVALVADFNHWDGRVLPMRSMGFSGVWELFVPGITTGEKYKFEIRTQEGHLLTKIDPYALWSEKRPATASVLFDLSKHTWQDAKWQKEKSSHPRPINIYEVHLGAWKKEGWHFLNYREIGKQLAAYCVEMGFSHVELMPILEHPLDESWGYQVTGFFAATSRYGTPEDFQAFVDILHKAGIGVILDWVPAHFPMDGHALAQFDGSSLFEHADPRQGFHPHWNTHIFNYGRNEVSNFLISSALFWLLEMHVDGLRVDAVASLLYLDYGRKEGEWIPNIYGGRENLEAIDFLKHLNSVIHEKAPYALMFAEESTSFLGVTHPLERGGLGFDYKWNMGWMNDTLRYMGKDPLFRSYHHNDLTFGLLYAFSEKFLLPLSHDEVVHGKASLLSKMPGDEWQKFANMRLLYSYLICQVGKKLLFMGGEIGQWQEWNPLEALPWHLLEHKRHLELQLCIRDLNHFYKNHAELWELDGDPSGFSWVDCSDRTNGVLCYLRRGRLGALLCVHHFSPGYFERYALSLRYVKEIKEVMNTDRKEYGGSDKVGGEIVIYEDKIEITLAPLSTMIFDIRFS